MFCVRKFDDRRELSFGAEGMTEFRSDGVFCRVTVLDCVVGSAPETTVDRADVGFLHYIDEVFGFGKFGSFKLSPDLI